MNRLGRTPFFTVWIYVVACAVVTWQEYYTPLSHADFRNLVIFRFFILGSAILSSFFLSGLLTQ